MGCSGGWEAPMRYSRTPERPGLVCCVLLPVTGRASTLPSATPCGIWRQGR